MSGYDELDSVDSHFDNSPAMTADLEQIAEEIENGSIAQEDCVARLRTWIAANKESPQRKAFVEAAREWMRSISQDGLYSQAKIAACETAYRAMIEAEKVEGVK